MFLKNMVRMGSLLVTNAEVAALNLKTGYKHFRACIRYYYYISFMLLYKIQITNLI